jgi:hypothetical protein
VTLTVCNRFAYGPISRCLTGGDSGSARAIADQTEFLSKEWTRLETLGRDPVAELGENPPWQN